MPMPMRCVSVSTAARMDTTRPMATRCCYNRHWTRRRRKQAFWSARLRPYLRPPAFAGPRNAMCPRWQVWANMWPNARDFPTWW